jgi:hypothetical protein
MSSLDLSFVEEKQDVVVARGTNNLDLSFLGKQPAKKEALKIETKAQDDRGILAKTKDFFTGSDRETEQTKALPEFFDSEIFQGADVSTLKGLGLTAAAMVTLDPDELANIISSNVPEISKVQNKDGLGNVIPLLVNNNTRKATIINRPGLSKMDGLQGVSMAAAFAPAVASSSASAPAAMLQTGVKSAAVQGGIESAQALSGGEFNTADVVLAGVGGAAFEGIAQGFGRAWPHVKQSIQAGKISRAVRQKFIKEAKNYGIPEDQLTDDVIRSWADKIDDRTGLEREFNTTLTKGQRSGDQAVLSAEDSFRSGIKGDKAQAAFLSEENKQLKNLTKSASVIQDDIARNSPSLATRNEAGAAIREGITNAEQLADDAIAQAYNQVGDASLTPDGFKGLLRATRKSVDSFEFPKEGNQASFKALLAEIKKAEKTINSASKLKNAKIKPVHIQKIESMRRAIGNWADSAANQTEKRNILQMKAAFDGYLDDAVIKGMFEGDTQSLQALRAARGTFRDYMEKFGSNVKTTRLGKGKDQAGEFVKKIVLENPTDEQVINSLWATSGFNKMAAANMAKRYKSILGKNSNEWNMVRQAAFDQLVAKKTVDGQMLVDGAKTFSNLEKATTQGSSLLKELFTPDEMAKIKRFAALAKKTAPNLVKSRENPSGTAQKYLKTLRNLLPFVDGGYSLAGSGAIIFKGSRNARAAKEAFRPFSKVYQSGRLIEGAAIGQSPALLETPSAVLLDKSKQASRFATQ